MLDYIHAGYSGPISLKQFASEAHMNPAYLCTLFSQSVGVSFKRYLINLRMEKARELLRDPGNHIADIAYAVGYADPNRFFAAFKGHTGTSPTLWRKGSPPDLK
jgi:two-component system response regulator YesN